MSPEERLFSAIDKIDDEHIVRAYNYKRKKKPVKVKAMTFVAACACLCLVIFYSINTAGIFGGSSVTVYAYGSNAEIGWQKPTIMQGTIDNDGEMHGAPMQFYLSGKSIKSVRFSCKNERMTFFDTTGKRGDYGYSKNFTVDYGDNEKEYPCLIINWNPEHIIRKLTDNDDIGISDLSDSEKEDIIVMQVTYENGKKETLAIKINLTQTGKFEAKVQKYRVSDKDKFVLGKDSKALPH